MRQATPKLIVVQRITVQWSKTTRSGPHAIARNRIAEAYPLPEGPFPPLAETTLALQTTYGSAASGFAPRHGTLEFQPYPGTLRHVAEGWFQLTDNEGEIRLRLEGDSLHVRVAMLRNYAPRPPSQFVATASVGEWVRFAANGRNPFPNTAERSQTQYRKDTINVALLERYARRVFVDKAPVREQRHLVDLF